MAINVVSVGSDIELFEQRARNRWKSPVASVVARFARSIKSFVAHGRVLGEAVRQSNVARLYCYEDNSPQPF